MLLVEPMWGIPYNLVATYASVYMLALGCSPTQIGLISSVGLGVAVLTSLAGGPLTDRLGRRRTTLVFDLVAWSLAALLWALARGFAWFLAAAVVNSFVRIVQTSWSLLAVEDTPAEERVHVFSWANMAGVAAGLFAPLAGLAVKGWGVVPAMRGLYALCLVSMTAMFLLRNALVRETQAGLARMHESRRSGAATVLRDYLRVVGRLARSRAAIVAFLVATLVSVQGVLRTTFLALLLTRTLGFPAAVIALFPALGAVVALGVYLFLLPTLSRWGTGRSLAAGLGVTAAASALMAASPAGSFAVVGAATVLGAAGSAVILPHADTLVMNCLDEADRAKGLSVYYVVLFSLSAPFGWIGGVLFDASGRLPFAAAAAILLAALCLCRLLPRRPPDPREE